ISMAYRIQAVPAHVVDPATPAQVRRPVEDEKRRKGFEMVKSAMLKAVSTRTVQEVPLGTGEGQFPAMERTIADLPSRDFFLKTLDAPGKLDKDGKVIMPPPKPAPGQQVRNDKAAAIVVADDPEGRFYFSAKVRILLPDATETYWRPFSMKLIGHPLQGWL